ncbi:hypothetical protein B0T09DRAFT_369391 [Sordaria sp. MPI-SDFR-AT-0083]|nr:hypothetical protein B0T09DRAFT_369391 [Sordaria sp. MPI-SDFR-AT-0083]
MSPLLPRPLSPYSLVLLAPTIPTCLAPSLNTEGIHIKFPTQNCDHGDHHEQSQEPQSPKSKKATPAPAPAPTPLSTEAQNATGILPASHWVTQPTEGKLYLAPLEKKKIEKELDIATGSGLWAIDFADEFPDAKVIGTDVSPDEASRRRGLGRLPVTVVGPCKGGKILMIPALTRGSDP